tara:strand:- start:5112 stop:5825 length:714 start_codon:yes stop_codon:yes gene_type:complete
MISIFEVIKQKSEILKFYKKASKINYKLKIKENKIFINFIIMPTLMLWISLMTFFFINGEGLSISQILSIFFGGLISSFYIVAILDPIFSFMYKRIAKVKKNKELKNPNFHLRYKGINNINDFIYKFEKSLDKKEEVYYLTENPFLNNNEYYYYFNIYMKSLENMAAEEIKKNNELLIENIKENFKIKEQKILFSKITYILTNNTADKELEELYLVLNNEEKRVELVNQKNQIIKKI